METRARSGAHRKQGNELEGEQERAALLDRLREERLEDREQEDEPDRHAREPRGHDAIVPDEVHGSGRGDGGGLRHLRRGRSSAGRSPLWQGGVLPAVIT